jgi:hypothetical protein
MSFKEILKRSGMILGGHKAAFNKPRFPHHPPQTHHEFTITKQQKSWKLPAKTTFSPSGFFRAQKAEN